MGMHKFLAHSSNDPDKVDPQPLDEHLKGVAALAARNASHFGAEKLAEAMGLLHDLGKYTVPFQERLAGARIKVDHSTRGAQVAQERYKTAGYLLAYGIAGHHAGLANGAGQNGERSPLAERLADKSLPPLEEVWKDEIELPKQEDFGSFIRGLSRADTTQDQNFQWAFLVRMLFSALVDADFIDTESYYDKFEKERDKSSSHRNRVLPTLEQLRGELDSHLKGFKADSEVNRLRAEILQYARDQSVLSPGIFSMNVPTGGGKTLSSLAFALDHATRHGQRRVIFVIPFTSIVEQNAAVFRKALGCWGDEAVLEHHSAFTPPSVDKSDPERYQSQEKLRLAMENWDAPIVVTTAVQFFESLFSAKPSQCRKLHNISNSVIILDEAQTIPLKVLRPAVAALGELARNYRSSVVLCTATQPALNAEKFKGGFSNVRPLVKDEAKLARQLERVSIQHVGALDDNALIDRLKEKHQVLCIVNNRLHARAVYKALEDLPGSVHLSTLMCAKHRSMTLAGVREALRKNEACRVVSTSLIEAGVDVSFPMVMRAEAGLDSIAQAAGRCNRNKEWPVESSKVLVFSNANPDWKPPVEVTQFAQAAREVLRRHQDSPLSPDAIQDYFQTLYWQKGDAALDAKGIMSLLSTSDIERLPMETMDHLFRLIDSVQESVIVPWDDTAKEAIRAMQFSDKVGGLARKLQPYIVQVPRGAFESLRKAGALQPIAPERWGEQFQTLVNMDLYSDRFGLWWEEPTFMATASTIL